MHFMHAPQWCVKRWGDNCPLPFCTIKASCKEKREKKNLVEMSGGVASWEAERVIMVVDLEKRMYMALAPEADILVQTLGETRLVIFC